MYWQNKYTCPCTEENSAFWTSLHSTKDFDSLLWDFYFGNNHKAIHFINSSCFQKCLPWAWSKHGGSDNIHLNCLESKEKESKPARLLGSHLKYSPSIEVEKKIKDTWERKQTKLWCVCVCVVYATGHTTVRYLLLPSHSFKESN